MENKTKINTEPQAGINKLLNAVAPTPKLSTDGTALDCVEGSRGSGIGATLEVLISCEESQEVAMAFRELGYNAYSNDLQDCSGGHPEWHLKMDARQALDYKQWDLVIAHPPCTRLSNSGVRWLSERNLWKELEEACEFFALFQNYYIKRNCEVSIGIENPIPHKYATNFIGKYHQIIHPWQFGHGEQKATCLWLYDLPKLKPTNIVEGREQKIWKMPPSEERAKLRSKTFPGIAKAMAEQWGTYVLQKNGVYV